ncbi:SAM-dependent DNA methyltransferase [Apilactobacillus micheneri]|uniref:N-6 DNA methylase n=1 Tax=Apilactobacillus micheneri TaxID=1899430 RepID=UPI00112B2542|nr:N-6 DNA methylase [Apilactobacillus micheneri]TPR43178.1 SAM-dependent DNA methyltransferase [Apilactobacillus micheneri]TPR47266.1 SAM-dependent DNA methyltransferase [Apilactobacillus micheneri]
MTEKEADKRLKKIGEEIRLSISKGKDKPKPTSNINNAHKDRNIGVDTINKLIGVSESYQAPDKLWDIMLDKHKRERLFDKFLEIEHKVGYDWFQDYFEAVQADRKKKKQDFTPNTVSKLTHRLIGDSKDYFEPTAGTGGMLIKKWQQDRMKHSPFTYRPHMYFYRLEELGDSAIAFLIFNMAIRGMNGTIFYGDSLSRECKQVFFIQNDTDEPERYSSVNVMPRTDTVEKYFDVASWMPKYPAVEHVESGKTVIKGAV